MLSLNLFKSFQSIKNPSISTHWWPILNAFMDANHLLNSIISLFPHFYLQMNANSVQIAFFVIKSHLNFSSQFLCIEHNVNSLVFIHFLFSIEKPLLFLIKHKKLVDSNWNQVLPQNAHTPYPNWVFPSTQIHKPLKNAFQKKWLCFDSRSELVKFR